ncbi:MAG: MFS transporter [Acetobacteraceae bacterium]
MNKRSETIRPFWGVVIVGLGTLVVPFDSSVNVAFPHIIRAFDLPIPAIQWVVIAYTLTYAALTLVFGRIGDMLGYRRIFLIGSAWSTIAFLMCAAAPSYPWLLAARVMQGIGAALSLSCGPALATSLYPETERTRVLGLYTMAFGIGGALGPVLAGQLVQFFGWQSVFWFRAPIAALAFLLTWRLPGGRPHGTARFDAPGAFLLVVSISAMLMALNQLQHIGTTIVWFAAAAVITVLATAAFIFRQERAAEPLMNLRYFRNPDFALVNTAHVLLNVAGFSIMLLVPFYLDRLSGLSVPMGGLVLAASPVGIMLSAPLAGRLATRVSSRRLALVGAAAMAIAQVAIGMAGASPDIPLLWASMFLQGFGLGLFQVAYFDIATATIPRQDRGVAGSLVMMTRTIGVVTGATTLMLIFQTMRDAARADHVTETAAFLTGFQTTFHLAALLPAAMVVAALLRGWAKASPRTH